MNDIKTNINKTITMCLKDLITNANNEAKRTKHHTEQK